MYKYCFCNFMISSVNIIYNCISYIILNDNSFHFHIHFKMFSLFASLTVHDTSRDICFWKWIALFNRFSSLFNSQSGDHVGSLPFFYTSSSKLPFSFFVSTFYFFSLFLLHPSVMGTGPNPAWIESHLVCDFFCKSAALTWMQPLISFPSLLLFPLSIYLPT